MTERKIALARQMRRKLTPPEFLLWERLKDRSSGLVFKHQQAIGPYILDFYCRKARLAIEVDGGNHGVGNRPEQDKVRDDWFASEGIFTYRILASEVFRDPDSVADGIWLLAVERSKQETPPPRP
jgi:very-short-patch-repair endonuclease